MENFNYINRGKKKDIVLLHGWATDNRIFDLLDIDYNYILPLELDPQKFEQEMLDYMSKSDKPRVSLLGWSMGSFIAADFAVKYSDLIDKLILVSIKGKYDKNSIEEIKKKITESRKAYLYKFYLDCFSEGEEDKLKWFRANLMRDYLEKFSVETLIAGLEYLSEAGLKIHGLNKLRPEIIYGMKDKIIPVNEIISLKQQMPDVKFTLIEGMGHLPFNMVL